MKPKYFINLEIIVDLEDELCITRDDGRFYITPIEDLNEVPQIIANYIKENIEARKEHQDA